MGNKPVYAWDANVFIAWLTNEQGAPLADIDAVVQEIDQSRANLITSVMAYSEILEIKHTPEQLKRFTDFLNRDNVIAQDVNIIIAAKAGQIRGRGNSANLKIKAEDSNYLATAVLLKANVLHTTDHQLLKLTGTSIVEGLIICPPRLISGQMIMLPDPSGC